MRDAVRVPDNLVALSTASVYPERTPDAFEVAATLGYDGVEVMVSGDPVSQDVDVLRRLSDYHHMPVLAIHAPNLLITQRVWGREPWGKLDRAKEVAQQLGARVIVVHPPFRWQRDYARDFEDGLARMGDETNVVFAVENMYPLRARGTEVIPYAPHWNPVDQDYKHVTLDLSHTAVSGSDALDLARRLGGRLSHVHLADGLGATNAWLCSKSTLAARSAAKIAERISPRRSPSRACTFPRPPKHAARSHGPPGPECHDRRGQGWHRDRHRDRHRPSWPQAWPEPDP